MILKVKLLQPGDLITTTKGEVVLSHIELLGVEKIDNTIYKTDLTDPKAQMLVAFRKYQNKHGFIKTVNLAYSPQDDRLYQVVIETNYNLAIIRFNARSEIKNCIRKLIRQHLAYLAK